MKVTLSAFSLNEDLTTTILSLSWLTHKIVIDSRLSIIIITLLFSKFIHLDEQELLRELLRNMRTSTAEFKNIILLSYDILT